MATITWRNLTAPQLQTNFQDNSLKGFSDLFSGLAQQNKFAKEKEIKDTTEALKASFFNYTGKEGEDALNTLRSSGQFGEMMAGLGDKVDQNAVREALLGTQTRLGQENQRTYLQAERDRLLAQKPYIDAADLLISQGKLPEAQAYASGLSQQGVLDNDYAAKVFGALRSAESTATDTSNRQALAKINLDRAQKIESDKAFVNRLMAEAEKVIRTPKAASEFYGMETPQYAAEAAKRHAAISADISKTFNIPIGPSGVIDPGTLSGPALDTYNKLYKDQITNLQVPKPASTISDRVQAFRQAALAQGVPVDVVSQFDETLQKKLKLEAPSVVGDDAEAIKREQQRLTTLKGRADAVSEQAQRSLSKEGLSGNLVSEINGQDLVIKRLKDLGLHSEAKDGDAQDKYSYIMGVVSDPDYSLIDAKVMNSLIDKVVASRASDIVNTDYGYGSALRDELKAYIASDKFKKHTRAVSKFKTDIDKVNEDYFTAKLRAAQLPTKKGT